MLLQERVRQLHQELCRLAADVHPQPRVVDAVATGLNSKNNRCPAGGAQRCSFDAAQVPCACCAA